MPVLKGKWCSACREYHPESPPGIPYLYCNKDRLKLLENFRSVAIGWGLAGGWITAFLSWIIGFSISKDEDLMEGLVILSIGMLIGMAGGFITYFIKSRIIYKNEGY